MAYFCSQIFDKFARTTDAVDDNHLHQLTTHTAQ